MGYLGYDYEKMPDEPTERKARDWRKEWGPELNQPVRYKPATGQEQTGTTTQTSTTEFSGERPEYDRPAWDEGEIRKISRKISAPNIRQLRQQVQRTVARTYENPNVKSLMLRNALQGYGIGLGSIVAQSESQARGEYARKYSFDMQEAMDKYRSAWNEYMASAKRTTTSTTAGKTQQTFGTGEQDWRDWGGPAVLNPGLRQRRKYWQFG